MYELNCGEILKIENICLSPGQLLKSKNAYIASVLQTGKVIGNMPGETELWIEENNNILLRIPCKVIGESSNLPLLLNRYNRIPTPVEKLETLAPEISTSKKEILINKKVASAFTEMCSAAKEQNIWLYAKEGYRTLKQQRQIIEHYTKKDGFHQAQRRCAPVGFSEHHSGLSIDVGGGSFQDNVQVRDDQLAWSWLQNNCHKYGFMIKNLPGKEHITGTQYEPWHIRYLGDLPLCSFLFEHQITLDEYLDQECPYTTSSLPLPITSDHPLNDIYDVWNDGKFEFTLNKIASISEGILVVPDCFQAIADKPIERLISSVSFYTPTDDLVVCFLPVYSESNLSKYEKLASQNTVFITYKEIKDSAGNLLPQILLPSSQDIRDIWVSIGSYLKRIFPMPTISVSGSLGKTTVTSFLQHIFRQKYKIFSSDKNRHNSSTIIQQMLDEFNPDYNLHIQEVSGTVPLSVERSARFLNSDAFCLLNILPDHLEQYKTVEASAHDHFSLDEFSKDTSFGVINLDDELLQNHPYTKRVVTYGIRHENADYVAKNIRHDGKWLKLDILHKEECISIQVNTANIQNTYSILAAFALAKEWGFSDSEIRSGFIEYESPLLQNGLHEIAGRVCYIDCFDNTAESIRTSLELLSSHSINPGNRKIAILSGVPELGESSFPTNYVLGLELSKYTADEFIIVGMPDTSPIDQVDKCGNGQAVFEGARRVLRNRPVSYFDRLDLVADKLIHETLPGDILLFKCFYKLPAFSILDRAFGTSFLVNGFSDQGKLWMTKTFSSFYYENIGSSNITQCNNIGSHISIPNTIIRKPVYRIGSNVFSKQPHLNSIDFGLSVQNIGAQSFEGCTSLTKLHIPSNVIYIEKEAFANCTALTEVILDGVLHLEKRAFANCSNLTLVYFNQECQTIEPEVFHNCPKITIVAPADSAAHRYAIDHHINFQERN